jgi:UDP-N-acetylenolpyruvoylglucosamine reductase
LWSGTCPEYRSIWYEVQDSIVKVSTVRTADGSKKIFQNYECRFGYRNSAFKNELKGNTCITRVYFKTSKNSVLQSGIRFTQRRSEQTWRRFPENVRKSVIKIRQSKLPDPAVWVMQEAFSEILLSVLLMQKLLNRLSGYACL